MATYAEIMSLYSNSSLKNLVQVACLVAANTIQNEDAGTANHANRLIWAKQTFDNPSSMSSKMFMAVLAANKDLTVAQIQF